MNSKLVVYQVISLLFVVYLCFATEVNQDITQDTVWTRSQSPYYVTQEVRVTRNLTIEEGVVVRVKCNASLIVEYQGELQILGSHMFNVMYLSTDGPQCKTGLIITETASPTIWDENGQYQTGSILSNALFIGASVLQVETDLYITDSWIYATEKENENPSLSVKLGSSGNLVVLNQVEVSDATEKEIAFAGTFKNNRVVIKQSKFATLDSLKFSGEISVELIDTTFAQGDATSRSVRDSEDCLLKLENAGRISAVGNAYSDSAVAFFISAKANVDLFIERSVFRGTSAVQCQSGNSFVRITNSSVSDSDSVVIVESGIAVAQYVHSNGQERAYYIGQGASLTIENSIIEDADSAIVSNSNLTLTNNRFINNSFTASLISVSGPAVIGGNQFINNAVREPGRAGTVLLLQTRNVRDLKLTGNFYDNQDGIFDIYFDAPRGEYIQALTEKWGSQRPEDRIFDYRKDNDFGMVFLRDFIRVSDNIEGSVVWTAESPYFISKNIAVPKSSALHIQKNAIVILSSCGQTIDVRGELKIVGAKDEPVYIGMESDCQYNDHGVTSVPILKFDSAVPSVIEKEDICTSGSTIENVIFRVNAYAPIVISKTSLFLSNVQLLRGLSDRKGRELINIQQSTRIVIKDSIFGRSEKAIDVFGTLRLVVKNSEFRGIDKSITGSTDGQISVINSTFTESAISEVTGTNSFTLSGSTVQDHRGNVAVLSLHNSREVSVTENSFNKCDQVISGSGRLMFHRNRVTRASSIFVWVQSGIISSLISENIFSEINSIGELASAEQINFELIDNTFENMNVTKTGVLNMGSLVMNNNVFRNSIVSSDILSVGAKYPKTSSITNNKFVDNTPDPEYSEVIFMLKLTTSVGKFSKNTFKSNKASVELEYTGSETLTIEQCDFGTSDLRREKLKIRDGKGSFPANVILDGIPRKGPNKVAVGIAISALLIAGVSILAIVLAGLFYFKRRREIVYGYVDVN